MTTYTRTITQILMRLPCFIHNAADTFAKVCRLLKIGLFWGFLYRKLAIKKLESLRGQTNYYSF